MKTFVKLFGNRNALIMCLMLTIFYGIAFAITSSTAKAGSFSFFYQLTNQYISEVENCEAMPDNSLLKQNCLKEVEKAIEIISSEERKKLLTDVNLNIDAFKVGKSYFVNPFSYDAAVEKANIDRYFEIFEHDIKITSSDKFSEQEISKKLEALKKVILDGIDQIDNALNMLLWILMSVWGLHILAAIISKFSVFESLDD